MCEILAICCACLLLPVYFLAFLLIPAGLILGIINLDQCPIDPHIPLWLIYFNGFVFVRIMISCYVDCCCNKDGWCAGMIKSLVFIGDIILMILGALYILPILNTVELDPEKAENNKNYCSRLTYIVAFVEIIWAWFQLIVYVALTAITIVILLIGGPAPPIGRGATAHGPKHYQFMGYITASAPGVDIANRFMAKADRREDVEMR